MSSADTNRNITSTREIPQNSRSSVPLASSPIGNGLTGAHNLRPFSHLFLFAGERFHRKPILHHHP
jgi:hypothetical protein